MIKIPVYNQEGKELESIALPNNIFGLKQNSGLLHLAAQIYLGNQRKGTAKVKTRAERRGGGKKPWKQKGTGRARAGTSRSPLWRKGGRIFGPTGEQNYHRELPKKTRIKALLMSLSAKAQQQKIIGLNKIDLSKISAKSFDQILRKLPEMRSALFVLPAKDKIIILSARNIPMITTRTYDNFNIMDVMNNEFIVLLKDAVPLVEKKWADMSVKGIMTDEEIDIALKKNAEIAKAEATVRAERKAKKKAKVSMIPAQSKKPAKTPKVAAKKAEPVKKETTKKPAKSSSKPKAASKPVLSKARTEQGRSGEVKTKKSESK